MRCVVMLMLVCMAGCNDDDERPLAGDAGVDASSEGVPSALPRPGLLERPPSALPDDLKPPR